MTARHGGEDIWGGYPDLSCRQKLKGWLWVLKALPSLSGTSCNTWSSSTPNTMMPHHCTQHSWGCPPWLGPASGASLHICCPWPAGPQKIRGGFSFSQPFPPTLGTSPVPKQAVMKGLSHLAAAERVVPHSWHTEHSSELGKGETWVHRPALHLPWLSFITLMGTAGPFLMQQIIKKTGGAGRGDFSSNWKKREKRKTSMQPTERQMESSYKSLTVQLGKGTAERMRLHKNSPVQGWSGASCLRKEGLLVGPGISDHRHR